MPSVYLGLWIDEAGRALYVELHGEELYASISQRIDGNWFRRTKLPFGSRETRRLPATLVNDRLVIEAGERGLGPTYTMRCVGGELEPGVQIGLYDDHDDDLGVPWAFPLEKYRRATEAELERYRARHADWLIAPLPEARARRKKPKA